MLEVTQQSDGRWTFDAFACDDRVMGAHLVTPAMAFAQAQRLVPVAAIGLAPHGTTLVNIETVMWADAPQTQTLPPVTLLGKRVVISLRLVAVEWDYGDGESNPDGPAGKKYDGVHDACRARLCPQYAGHVYRSTGPVIVTARGRWQAQFAVDGAKPVTVPGLVRGPRAQARLVVKQARGVLVANPGD